MQKQLGSLVIGNFVFHEDELEAEIQDMTTTEMMNDVMKKLNQWEQIRQLIEQWEQDDCYDPYDAMSEVAIIMGVK